MTSLLGLLIVVGLPLLVWQLLRQGAGSRLRTRLEADPATQLLQRHGLAGRDAVAVTTAVERGRQLQDPVLRRAAVDLARLSLARVDPRRQQLSTGPRVVLVLVAVWVSLVVADAAFALAFGRVRDVNWFALLGTGLAVSSPVRRDLRLHRAIELNADRPARGG